MKRILAIGLWLLSISLSAQVIVSAEFFWGTVDPGAGNGTSLSASDGAFDEAVEEVVKAGIALPASNGIHLFNIRIKDEEGHWGVLFKKAVSIENSLTLRNLKVTSAEFFWGTVDPGAGSGTTLLAFDNAFDDALESVFKSNVSLPGVNGIHLFNIRTKDEDGNWGPLFKKAVSIENSLTLRDLKLTGAEFFWGASDPGEGNGTALLAFDNAFDEALETVFKANTSLPSSNGIHLFNIRVKDESGTWGPVFKKAVSIENSLTLRNLKLTGAEFFWGVSDPGEGSGTALIAFDNAYDEALEVVFKTNLALPGTNGIHLFNIRVKDEEGHWGPVFKKAVSLENALALRNLKLTGAEFFWGSIDPGEGSGTTLLAFDNAFDEALEVVFNSSISLPSSNGIHLFNIRVKDEDGNWGPLFKKAVSVENSLTLRDLEITAVEFFWGLNDPGAGNGLPALAINNAYDEALETVFKAGAYPPENGWNLFNIRAADEDGNWGPLFKKAIWTEIGVNPIQISLSTLQGLDCYGDANAGVYVEASGGAAPYQMLWSTGSTNDSLTGLSAGTYYITVTDASGRTKRDSITFTSPNPLLVSTLSSTTSACNSATGSVSVVISGGTAPYSASWPTGVLGTQPALQNGSYTLSASSLSAGSYSIQITDAHGCTQSHSFTIANTTTSFTTTLSKVDPGCAGSSSGAVSASITGGATPYSYYWSNASTASSLTNVAAGTYWLRVTDANGCQVYDTITLTDPNGMTLSASPASYFGAYNISCSGGSNGSAVVSISGGSLPYSILWSTGSTSPTISGLSAGSYSVQVTDGNGCTATATVAISEPSALTLSTAVTSAISCFGDTDGSVTVAVSGGVAPYTYLWNTGSTTATASGLASGTYTVVVTDNNSCAKTASVTLTTPAALNTTAQMLQSVSCFGGSTGSAQVTASGGTPPYTYSWSTGGTSATAAGLSAGTYSVTVTDASSCVSTSSVSITQSTAMTVSIAVLQGASPGSSNGILSASVSGGTAPYTYAWTPSNKTTATANGLSAGTYSVVVTDANGCSASASKVLSTSSSIQTTLVATAASCYGAANGSIVATSTGGAAPYSYVWSNGSTGSSITGLPAGSYSVTVTDATGATATQSTTVSQPLELLLTVDSTSNYSGYSLPCFGSELGWAQVHASGGTAPYTYSWTNGSTGSYISGLSSGLITVVATDAQGCTVSQTLSLTGPQALSATVSAVSNISCFGASNAILLASPQGGVSPYSYVWSTGASTQSVSGLSAGTYSVTITDANGCATAQTATVTQPDPLGVETQIQDSISCQGAGDGVLAATVSGGQAPYSYSWNTGDTSEFLYNVFAGIYSVTVTDANNCTQSSSILVTDPSPLTAIITVDSAISCAGAANGVAHVTATGGHAPYTYSWSHGPSTQSVSNLSVGSYAVTITDARGCSISTSTAISEPAALSASVSVLTNFNGYQVACLSDSNAWAVVLVSGGVQPYSYTWSTGSTLASTGGLWAGTHSVTVEDANGCATTQTFALTAPSPLSVAYTVTQPTCSGSSTGSISLNVSGGVSPYSYAWSNGAAGSTQTGLLAGSYTCTITDANGCSVQQVVEISDPSPIATSTSVISNFNGFGVNCSGNANGMASVAVVSGGTAPFSYAWSSGSTSATATGLAAGWHYVTITDAALCSTQDSVLLTAPSTLAAAINLQQPISCYGQANGQISLSISGGAAPYSVLWNDGSSQLTRSNLTPGTYSVLVTDANNCITSTSISLSQPSALNLNLSVLSSILCQGGTTGALQATITGGTAPYTLSWSNGGVAASNAGLSAATYSILVQDASGCTIADSITLTEPVALMASSTVYPVSCFGQNDGAIRAHSSGGTGPYSYAWSTGATGDSLYGLAAGYYQVLITDQNGCSTTLSVTVSQPAAMTASAAVLSNVSCYGGADGSATATPTGGTAPYSYLWSSGELTQTAVALSAGMQSVTITDASGCSVIQSVGVTEPLPLTITHTVLAPVLCNGASNGVAEVNVSGGTGPYAITWDNGATGSVQSNLGGGSHTVVVVDQKGCSDSIQFTMQEPAALNASITSSAPNCFGENNGWIFVEVLGGTGTKTVQWTHGASGTYVDSLQPGWYYFTIEDDNACSFSDSVFLMEPEELTWVLDTVSPTCLDADNGSIRLQGFGGTGALTYYLGDTEFSGEAENLPVGTYYLRMKDEAGCEKSTQLDLLPIREECLEIPNWFSPNDNSIEDVWRIEGIEFGQYMVKVFNIQGQVVYSSESPGFVPWDGTKDGQALPEGEYLYIVQDLLTDKRFTGYVTLLR